MGQLCIYLTPFASDYSGVCSALFDLNCMTAINDAGCCTSHYVYYDEPRWNGQIRPVFSTAIRSIDCVLGNDGKIINAVCEATAGIAPGMVAVIGTPVPALTGMDMDGLAAEIEYRTGLPTFGFNTSGFQYYDKGIFAAGKALIDRFAEPMPVTPGLVNICGMTPLDFGNCGNDLLLQDLLQEQGFEIGCNFFMGITMEQIARCAAAERNIAVSASGLRLAKYLKKKFGTPYTAGFPIAAGEAKAGTGFPDTRLLIIADQVIGSSIRTALTAAGIPQTAVTVATFFGFDPDLALPGDLFFREEADYLDYLRDHKDQIIIADPDILNVPAVSTHTSIPLVHPAVSSQRKWQAVCLLDHRLIDHIMTVMKTGCQTANPAPPQLKQVPASPGR